MDIKSKIISALSSESLSARELSRRLNVEKSKVNAALYSDKVFTQNNTSPPTWSIPSSQKKKTTDIDTIIFLDLGNVHDCLKNVESYARAGEIFVFAFCDYAYTGYPISEPRYSCEGVRAVRTSSPKKNAADTALIWTCCSIVNRQPGGIDGLGDVISRLTEKLEFIVVTKDQGFGFLQDLVLNAGHSITFCRDWDDLKLLI